MTHDLSKELAMGRRLLPQAIAGLHRYAEPINALIGTRRRTDLVNEIAAVWGPMAIADSPILVCCGPFSSGKTAMFSRLTGLELPSDRSPTTRCHLLIEATDGITSPQFEVSHTGTAEAERLLWRVLELQRASLGDDFEQGLETLRGSENVKAAANGLGEILVEGFGTCRDPAQRIELAEAAFFCRSVSRFLDESQALMRFEAVTQEEAFRLSRWGQGEFKVKFDPTQFNTSDGLRTALDDWFGGDEFRRLVEQRRKARTRVDMPALRREYETFLQIGVIGFLRIRVPAGELFQPGIAWADSPGAGASLIDQIKLDLLMGSVAGGFVFVNLRQPGHRAEDVLKATFRELGGKQGYIFTHADDLIPDAVLTPPEDNGQAAQEFLDRSAEVLRSFAEPLDLWGSESEMARLLEADGEEWSKRITLVHTHFDQANHEKKTRKVRSLGRLAVWLDERDLAEHVPPHLRPTILQSANGHPVQSAEILSQRLGLSQRKVVRLIGLLIELSHSGGLSGMRRMMQHLQQDGGVRKRETLAQSARRLIGALDQLPWDELTTETVLTLTSEQEQAITLVAASVNGVLARSREVLKTTQFHRELLAVGDVYCGVQRSQAKSTLAKLLELGYPPEVAQQMIQAADQAAGDAELPTLDDALELARTSLSLRGDGASFRKAATSAFREIVALAPRHLNFHFDRYAAEVAQRLTHRLHQVATEQLGSLANHSKRAAELNMIACRKNAPWQAFLNGPGKKEFSERLAGQFRSQLRAAMATYWTSVLDIQSPCESLPLREFDPSRDVDAFMAMARPVCEHRLATVLLRAVASLQHAAIKEFAVLEANVRSCYDRDELVQASLLAASNDPAMNDLQRRQEATRLLRKINDVMRKFADRLLRCSNGSPT
jgi:hypothetical protein